MRSFAFLALLALVLAGCAGSKDESSSQSGTTSHSTSPGGPTSATGTTTSHSGSGSSSTSTSGPTGNNHEPIAQLGASASAGSAPFRVNFTVSGTDQDNDPLTWTLKFGDAAADAKGS